MGKAQPFGGGRADVWPSCEMMVNHLGRLASGVPRFFMGLSAFPDLWAPRDPRIMGFHDTEPELS